MLLCLARKTRIVWTSSSAGRQLHGCKSNEDRRGHIYNCLRALAFRGKRINGCHQQRKNHHGKSYGIYPTVAKMNSYKPCLLLGFYSMGAFSTNEIVMRVFNLSTKQDFSKICRKAGGGQKEKVFILILITWGKKKALFSCWTRSRDFNSLKSVTFNRKLDANEKCLIKADNLSPSACRRASIGL